MATRKVKRRNLTKHQLGDLRERIEVGDNVLRSGGFGNSGMVRRFVTEAPVWAKVEDVNRVGDGEITFNGVNISTIASHVMTMRYRPNFTSEKWIRWDGEAYRVDKVLDPEQRKQYTVAFVYLEGEQAREANT